MEKIKSLNSGDLALMALNNELPNIRQILEIYADRNNWFQLNDENGCHWTWIGPVICGYELAQIYLKRNDNVTF